MYLMVTMDNYSCGQGGCMIIRTTCTSGGCGGQQSAPVTTTQVLTPDQYTGGFDLSNYLGTDPTVQQTVGSQDINSANAAAGSNSPSALTNLIQLLVQNVLMQLLSQQQQQSA